MEVLEEFEFDEKQVEIYRKGKEIVDYMTREIVARIDGENLTAGKVRMLYEWYDEFGEELGARWRFIERRIANRYEKYAKWHLQALARMGLLEEDEGPRGGVAYKITPLGAVLLFRLGLI